MQLVVVKFVDPTFYDFWASMDEVAEAKCNFCFAAGWLIEDNEEWVKVACIVGGDKTNIRSWCVVPKEAVRELSVIKEVDWRVPNG